MRHFFVRNLATIYRHRAKLFDQEIFRPSTCFLSRNPAPGNRTLATKMAAPTNPHRRDGLLFRQLFEMESCTYTYLLACTETKQALLIDPVLETVDRDAEQVRALGLTLVYGVNTHCHADHITGTGTLRTRHFPTMKSVIGADSTAAADLHIKEDDVLECGHLRLRCLATPGHTTGCLTYLLEGYGMAFTGDALLIRGCGRTDFQGGSASQLYDNVTKKILSLPKDTLLFPAHDYKGRTVTTVDEELRLNPRLTKPKDEFIKIMDELGLPYPKKIDASLPANLVCGVFDVDQK